jgi:hypothetical protein
MTSSMETTRLRWLVLCLGLVATSGSAAAAQTSAVQPNRQPDSLSAKASRMRIPDGKLTPL